LIMNASTKVGPHQSQNDFSVPGPVRDGDELPGALAPLVRNAWYVVAESKDVGRELRGIRALGEPLVLFRTEAGEPIVLDDRCAHRRFPLSKSKLVGDRIQCGYHGFTYEPSGRCVWAPTNIKPNFGVRRYPCIEIGPWVWAWMGDPDKADPAAVPYPQLDRNEMWRTIEGYKLNPGNYMLLIENLLDLAHLHFLHGGDVSDIAQANTPSNRLPNIANGVGYTKETPLAEAKLFASLTGGDPAKKVRVVTADMQLGPSLNYGYEDRYALDGQEDPLYPLRFHIIHGITPEGMNTTHQFFQVFFNRELLGGMESFRDFSEDVVLQQDCEAIACIQSAIESDRRTGTVELNIASDRYGIAMRGILRKLKQEELGAENRERAAPT
jgi:phenylpropionate dioxygenase-like ring-hydroxylating dioxygenase large terminal subunit